MVKVAIIDYGVGNVKSLKHSLEKVGAQVDITSNQDTLIESDGLFLPGVGAFEPAINNLLPMVELIKDQINNGKTLMGICLGLQLFFTESFEGVEPGQDTFKGLNLVEGSVRFFPKNMGLSIPHMGWNSIEVVQKDHPLFQDIKDGSYVYFVHSLYGDTKNEADIITKTNYGFDFASTVGNKNFFATQFHPEKSGKVGLQILTNYLEYIKK